MILDILGSGTFGQVAKCKNKKTGELVGVKVIKNKPAYTKQSLIEVDILTHVSNTKLINYFETLTPFFLSLIMSVTQMTSIIY
jgi:serine/threonine protein kinase